MISTENLPLPDFQAGTLLDERQVADRLRLSAATLQKMRREGKGPSFIRIGAAVRYPEASLRDWLSSLSREA